MPKLLCIPYAGSSAEVYRKWAPLLGSRIDVVPLELPGRGKRFSEPFYESFSQGAADLANQVLKQLTGNDTYALFGHSMGSWLAYEVYRKLQQEGAPMPFHLFVSGNHAPQIPKEEKQLHKLPPREFQKEILAIGGTPEIIFENPDLASIYVPVLRNDYRILESYSYEDDGTLVQCPVTVIAGQDDTLTNHELRAWGELCGDVFDVAMIQGNHFYITEDPQPAIRVILKEVLMTKGNR